MCALSFPPLPYRLSSVPAVFVSDRPMRHWMGSRKPAYDSERLVYMSVGEGLC